MEHLTYAQAEEEAAGLYHRSGAMQLSDTFAPGLADAFVYSGKDGRVLLTFKSVICSRSADHHRRPPLSIDQRLHRVTITVT